MPFARPSLSELRDLVAQDIAAELPGSDPLLPNSDLSTLGVVLAGLAHLHYGYLDWIALQSNPWTATDEYLELWAALKGVNRAPATRASGSVVFTGVNGTVVPAGLGVARGDGRTYTTTSGGTVSGGSITVTATATADPAGLDGAGGNCAAGTVMALSVGLAGVNGTGTASTPFTGGADLEDDDSLRRRMFLAYQNPGRGGSRSDYVRWAFEVPGVTRAWCVPHGYGEGTVVVYPMFDVTEAAFGGFPQGTNGSATGESRYTTAVGDQLAVANHIAPLQPATALVIVQAPAVNTVNVTIGGLTGSSVGTRAAIAAAMAAVFTQYGSISAGATTIALSYLQAAIATVPGTTGFVLVTPAVNIVSPAGSLPVLGSVTYVP